MKNQHTPSPFLQWMDRHILFRFRGKFGYTVLFGAIAFFSLLLALGINDEAQGAQPFFTLMFWNRMFVFPAIICWGTYVGTPYKPPQNLLGQTFFFLLGIICFLIVVSTTAAMAVLFYF